ncbi:MAG TPA: sugar ABC transporter substrate-binding protein [Mycobacteriales bacterium]|nr:sugar ABC transporter substrate-binding protein [Mycobacteriales bacterium]
MTSIRAVAGGALSVLALSGLAACGGSSSGGSNNGTGSSQAGGSKCKIALMLPETKTTRYETADKPDFIAAVQQADSSCKVDYYNADQDSTKQQSQAQTALTNGDTVLVLDAVDGKAAAKIVSQAKQQNVPTLAYDRLASGPVAYYVSFDNQKVGQLQGTALVDAMKKNGAKPGDGIVMINGSPTDPNAAQFKAGAHSVIDKSGFKVLREFDTTDWDPSTARQEMAQSITSFGSKIKGVYVANDGMAAGVVAALQAAHVNPLPPVTGQDAQVDGIQRILAGQQTVTIYKAIKPEATKAAQVAVQLAKGQSVSGDTTVKNDSGNTVQATLLTPVAVTRSNVESTVVKDGFLTASAICTPQYQKYCQKYGVH